MPEEIPMILTITASASVTKADTTPDTPEEN